MTRIVLTSFCIGALLLPVALHSQPEPSSSPTAEELKAGFEKQDAELNKLYKETMARLPPVQQKELKQSEVEWLKYRDQEEATTNDPQLHWHILSFNGQKRLKTFAQITRCKNGPYPPPGYSEAADEGCRISQGRFCDQGFSWRR